LVTIFFNSSTVQCAIGFLLITRRLSPVRLLILMQIKGSSALASRPLRCSRPVRASPTSAGGVDDVSSLSGTRQSLGILRCAYGTARDS
jgi:hypothetical protein